MDNKDKLNYSKRKGRGKNKVSVESKVSRNSAPCSNRSVDGDVKRLIGKQVR